MKLETVFFEKIVLQPTSLCNLNCSYCYLPGRNKNHKMLPSVANQVAKALQLLPHKVSLIWHGGEPLACGLNYFHKLIEPFSDLENSNQVTHFIQTNGTLIDTNFCSFFLENKFRVGVSIDGPAWANINRVDWNGKTSFSKIVEGIECLKSAKVPFSVIAVVNQENLNKAKELFTFFCELGCTALGINIEEEEGINKSRFICDDEKVTLFWANLFSAWQSNPAIEIREFRYVLSWAKAVNDGLIKQFLEHDFDIFPTITWNGDVIVLSPEFAGHKSEKYGSFVVGNVLEKPLMEILADAMDLPYVVDYRLGVKQCQKECKYFSFCQGGQASNKFFELNTTNGTQTVCCRNSKQRLIDAVLRVL